MEISNSLFQRPVQLSLRRLSQHHLLRLPARSPAAFSALYVLWVATFALLLRGGATLQLTHEPPMNFVMIGGGKFTVFPFLLLRLISSAQSLFDVHILPSLHSIQNILQQLDLGIGLAAKSRVVVLQGEHLDGVGPDEQEDADEESCRVPFFFPLRFYWCSRVVGIPESLWDD